MLHVSGCDSHNLSVHNEQRMFYFVMWFQVANGFVRANALCLFMDAFPLKSDEMGVAELEALIQKQIDLLQVSRTCSCWNLANLDL